MRVNSKVHTERTDLTGEIRIPNCEPKELRLVAERLVAMLTKLDAKVPSYPNDYRNITELNKMLTINYWREYNRLDEALAENRFHSWFLKTAGNPDLISRAVRWLVQRNYLLLEPEILERAYKAADKFSRSITTIK